MSRQSGYPLYCSWLVAFVGCLNNNPCAAFLQQVLVQSHHSIKPYILLSRPRLIYKVYSDTYKRSWKTMPPLQEPHYFLRMLCKQFLTFSEVATKQLIVFLEIAEYNKCPL